MKKTTPPVLDAFLIDALASGESALAPDTETSQRIRTQLFQRVHGSATTYMFIHSHEGEWVRLRKGVELKILRQDAQSRSYLLRIAPGARLPPHDHPVDEECLVLEGDATVDGILCRQGDYHLAPQGKPHDWLTSENGCLLFVRGAIEQHAHRS
ncbi:MAG: cupin domain-containing protein [Thiobacillus sp.]|nr:cupin domain-containing protein [Thiobacillus sp.]